MDYEKAVEDFYVSVLRPGDIVVDCGAHNGRHTLPMARAVGKGGRVYAFEPLKPIFEKLVAKIAGEKNVIVENIALGEKETTTNFVYVRDFPEYSGFRERIYHDQTLHREDIEVHVKRLDEVVANKSVRYVKIDAEGGDLQIIRGAAGLLDRARPIVTFELGDNSLINYDYTSGEYFDTFARHGYRIFSITGIEMDRPLLIENSAKQEFWDYIACPAELVNELPFVKVQGSAMKPRLFKRIFG